MAKHKVDIEVGVSGQSQTMGALDSIAAKVRMLKREDAKSGENALGSMLRGGLGGMAGVGLSAIGIGLPALMIEGGARLLGDMAKEAENLQLKLADGAITAGDMFEHFAASVPVLGTVRQAAHGIWNAFKGEKLTLELINREAKLTTEYFEAQTKYATLLRGTLRDIGNEADGRAARAQAAGAQNPVEMAGILQPNRIATLEEADKKAMDARVKELRDVGNATYLNLQKQAKNLEDQAGVIRSQVKGVMNEAQHKEEITQVQQLERQAQILREQMSSMAVKTLADIDKVKGASGVATAAGISAIQAEDDAAYRKFRDAQLKAERDARDEHLRDAQETTDKKLEIAKDGMKAVEQQQEAESGLRQKALRAQGKDLEAEVEQIREAYRRKREAALSDPERSALTASEALDIAAAKKGKVNPFVPHAAVGAGESERFLTGVNAAILSNMETNRGSTVEKKLTEAVTALKDITTHMKSAEAAVTKFVSDFSVGVTSTGSGNSW